jgi:hypothetical protein
MAITAQELNIILSAKDKQFSQAMDRANKRVQRFANKSQKDMKKVGQGFDGLGKAARRLAPLLAGVFSVRAISRMVDSAREIGILADVAGVSATRFQKMAAASKTVGIEQGKLSDILKDVNDKLGDYLITGAGPLADFFETIAPLVGVTADSFRDLNSADALQLYIDSLEKANVSQAQMTFFLEAIASDATALAPLLKDNGSEMKRLGDEAERTGRILSNDAVDGAKDLAEKFDVLKDKTGTMIQQALLDNADDILALVQRITDMIPTVVDAAERAMAFINGGPVGGAQISPEQAAIDAADDRAFFESENKPGGSNYSDPSGTGNFMVDPKTGTIIDLADPESSGLAMEALAAVGLRDDKPAGPKIKTQKERDAEAKANQQFLKDLASAQKGYDSLLASLDPAAAAQMEYNKGLETMNELERLSGEQIANKGFVLQGLEAQLQRAKDEMSGMADVTDALEQGLTNVFMSALDGTKSMEEAFKSMAKQVIAELYRVLVVQRMVNAAMGIFGFSPVPGGGFTRTGAGGRQLQAGQTYMTGESGRELFVPSTPGRLLSPAQTKDAMRGGGAGVQIVQNINVSTGVQQTVRNEIKTLMPQIANTAKSAVLDAKRRGGAYGAL